jgi:hypothetical protein
MLGHRRRASAPGRPHTAPCSTWRTRVGSSLLHVQVQQRGRWRQLDTTCSMATPGSGRSWFGAAQAATECLWALTAQHGATRSRVGSSGASTAAKAAGQAGRPRLGAGRVPTWGCLRVGVGTSVLRDGRLLWRALLGSRGWGGGYCRGAACGWGGWHMSGLVGLLPNRRIAAPNRPKSYLRSSRQRMRGRGDMGGP